MVMGDNSCYRGCGFESLHRILDGHFFIDLLKIALFVCLFEKTKKRPGMANFKKQLEYMGSNFGAVGRLVTSDTGDPHFESSNLA